MIKKRRLIIGKLGLDGHDNGLRIIAKWLMDSGYEIIYAGLYNTPEKIVQTAIEEDVDVVGISFLGGEHLHYADVLLKILKEKKMQQVKVILGGVIPPPDVKLLISMGVDVVFTPGSSKKMILDGIAAVMT